jgi:CheY-like chemotaxis protein
MLEQLAELYGHPATGAATAQAAVQTASRELPRLALIDIGLDGSDGFEVARTLRQLPGGEGVHLVALTGYSDAVSRSRASQAGFNEFVVKPMTPEKFKALLAET